MALVIRREDDRSVEIAEMLESLYDRRVGERARERKDPGGLRQATNQRDGPSTIPGRKIYWLVDRLGRRAALDELLQVTDAGHFGEPSFVDPCLKTILERDHQLDSLE